MIYFLKITYSLFLYILIFFSTLSHVLSDELDIILGATTKHYCSCLFVSELSKEQCDIMFQRSISNAVSEPELINQIKTIEIQIESTSKEISMQVEDKIVRSVFAGKKGCYLDN